MRCLGGCLLFVLGAAAALAGVAFYAFLFSPSANLPLLPAAASGSADITITLTETYVNDQLRAALAQQGFRASDFVLDLQPPNRGIATMTMNVRVLGQNLNVRPRATLRVEAQNGAVVLQLDSVDVSGISVPQAIVNQQFGALRRIAQDELNAQVRQSLAGTGLHLAGVETTSSALILRLAR